MKTAPLTIHKIHSASINVPTGKCLLEAPIIHKPGKGFKHNASLCRELHQQERTIS